MSDKSSPRPARASSVDFDAIMRGQVEPQLIAQEARRKGRDVDLALVDRRPDAEGVEITCGGCSATAKVPASVAASLSPTKVPLCPNCVRKMRIG